MHLHPDNGGIKSAAKSNDPEYHLSTDHGATAVSGLNALAAIAALVNVICARRAALCGQEEFSDRGSCSASTSDVVFIIRPRFQQSMLLSRSLKKAGLWT